MVNDGNARSEQAIGGKTNSPANKPMPPLVSDSDSDALVIDIGELPPNPPAEPSQPLQQVMMGCAKDPAENGSTAETVNPPSPQKPPAEAGGEMLKPSPKRGRGRPKGSKNVVRRSVGESDFEHVEDAMAAMFAGVVSTDDERSKKAPAKGERKKPGRKPTEESERKAGSSKKKQPQGSGRVGRDSSNTNGKGHRGNRGKDKPQSPGRNEQDRLLEKYKGPFVRVEGNVDSPKFVSMINSPLDPLDSEEQSKRGICDLEQRVRVTGFGPGCCSTLSSRYDPKRADPSWACVFCNKGSHVGGLGDLFGPYFVSTEAVKMGNHNRSPLKTSQDLAVKFILGGDRSRKRKWRRSPEGGNKNLAEAHVGEMEVWFHEDCVCWMPDIRLVGNVIVGLEDAISSSQRALCSRCHERGSTMGCVANGCREFAHFDCAQAGNWKVDEENFQALCPKHSAVK